MSQEEQYWNERHLEGSRGFYIHFTAYLGVNSLLLVIDLVTPGSWWFFWPLLLWGIGVMAHAVTVFGVDHLLNQLVEVRNHPRVLEWKRWLK